MGQLLFEQNNNNLPSPSLTISNGTLLFAPFLVNDNISLGTLNVLLTKSAANMTFTVSLGLYSLTGSTLSIANSASRSFSSTNSGQAFFLSMATTSATQNISAGVWWFGFLLSTGGNSNLGFHGGFNVAVSNPFPGSFIGGRMTDSTNALPSSYATSDLDTTGADALYVPYLLITA